MSLQRGSFGIEFDDRPGFPYQKLWWTAVLIPLIALPLLFFRGCQCDRGPLEVTDDLAPPTNQEVSELKAVRPRPSVLEHFRQSWWKAPADDKHKRQAADAAEKESWMDALPSTLLPSVQKQSPEVRRLLAQVTGCEAADDLVGARRLFRGLLVRSDAEELRAFVERRIGEINVALLYADRPSPEKVRHRVEAGDLVERLTRQYGNTQEYLLKANGIEKPERLRIGREIWVLKNPVFELTVFKAAGTSVLTLNGRFFKRYPSGVGKPAESPNGIYVVRSRVRKPASPSPEHGEAEPDAPRSRPGSFWISLGATGDTPETEGLGLHGTWNESTLGRQVDAGRIRFSNADIEELYTLLPAGTVVNITE